MDIPPIDISTNVNKKALYIGTAVFVLIMIFLFFLIHKKSSPTPPAPAPAPTPPAPTPTPPAPAPAPPVPPIDPSIPIFPRYKCNEDGSECIEIDDPNDPDYLTAYEKKSDCIDNCIRKYYCNQDVYPFKCTATDYASNLKTKTQCAIDCIGGYVCDENKQCVIKDSGKLSEDDCNNNCNKLWVCDDDFNCSQTGITSGTVNKKDCSSKCKRRYKCDVRNRQCIVLHPDDQGYDGPDTYDNIDECNDNCYDVRWSCDDNTANCNQNIKHSNPLYANAYVDQESCNAYCGEVRYVCSDGKCIPINRSDPRFKTASTTCPDDCTMYYCSDDNKCVAVYKGSSDYDKGMYKNSNCDDKCHPPNKLVCDAQNLTCTEMTYDQYKNLTNIFDLDDADGCNEFCTTQRYVCDKASQAGCIPIQRNDDRFDGAYPDKSKCDDSTQCNTLYYQCNSDTNKCDPVYQTRTDYNSTQQDACDTYCMEKTARWKCESDGAGGVACNKYTADDPNYSINDYISESDCMKACRTKYQCITGSKDGCTPIYPWENGYNNAPEYYDNKVCNDNTGCDIPKYLCDPNDKYNCSKVVYVNQDGYDSDDAYIKQNIDQCNTKCRNDATRRYVCDNYIVNKGCNPIGPDDSRYFDNTKSFKQKADCDNSRQCLDPTIRWICDSDTLKCKSYYANDTGYPTDNYYSDEPTCAKECIAKYSCINPSSTGCTELRPNDDKYKEATYTDLNKCNTDTQCNVPRYLCNDKSINKCDIVYPADSSVGYPDNNTCMNTAKCSIPKYTCNPCTPVYYDPTNPTAYTTNTVDDCSKCPKPATYKCNPTTGKCEQSSYGHQTEEDCLSSCKKVEYGGFMCVDNKCQPSPENDPRGIYDSIDDCQNHCSPILPPKVMTYEDSADRWKRMSDVITNNCNNPKKNLDLDSNSRATKDNPYVALLDSINTYGGDSRISTDPATRDNSRYFIVENKCPIDISMGYIGYNTPDHKSTDPSTYNMFDVQYVTADKSSVYQDESRTAFGGFNLRSGEAAILQASDPIVSGRMWPRTKCSIQQADDGTYAYANQAVNAINTAIVNRDKPENRCIYIAPDQNYKYKYTLSNGNQITAPFIRPVTGNGTYSGGFTFEQCLPCPTDNIDGNNYIADLPYIEAPTGKDCDSLRPMGGIIIPNVLEKKGITYNDKYGKENLTGDKSFAPSDAGGYCDPSKDESNEIVYCTKEQPSPDISNIVGYTANIPPSDFNNVPNLNNFNNCKQMRWGCETGDVNLPCGVDGICGYAGCIASGYCDPYKYPPRGGLGPMGTTGLSPGLTLEYTLSNTEVENKLAIGDYYDISLVDGFSNVPLSMEPIEGRSLVLKSDIPDNFNTKPAVCGKLCEENCPYELRSYNDDGSFRGCVSICHAVREQSHREEFKKKCIEMKQSGDPDAKNWPDCCILDKYNQATVYWDPNCIPNRQAPDKNPWFGSWMTDPTSHPNYQPMPNYGIPDETFKTVGCWKLSDNLGIPGTEGNKNVCGMKQYLDPTTKQWAGSDNINNDYIALMNKSKAYDGSDDSCKFLSDLLCCDVGQLSLPLKSKDCLDPYPNSDKKWTYTDNGVVADNVNQFGCSPYNEKYGLSPDRIKYYQKKICWIEDWPKPSKEWCDKQGYTTPEQCTYAADFKKNCPNAYSWQFDDLSSTYMAKGADYYVTLCPELS